MTRQQAASISGLSPAFIAAEDYRMGGGQDDNPYQDGTAEHEQYAFHMHKLSEQQEIEA